MIINRGGGVGILKYPLILVMNENRDMFNIDAQSSSK